MKHERTAVMPLCPVHRSLDSRDALECKVQNNCVACSLNEREALLSILTPCTPAGGAEDSVTVLQRVVDFYLTHYGENRVVVSRPVSTEALSPQGEKVSK